MLEDLKVIETPKQNVVIIEVKYNKNKIYSLHCDNITIAEYFGNEFTLYLDKNHWYQNKKILKCLVYFIDKYADPYYSDIIREIDEDIINSIEYAIEQEKIFELNLN